MHFLYCSRTAYVEAMRHFQLVMVLDVWRSSELKSPHVHFNDVILLRRIFSRDLNRNPWEVVRICISFSKEVPYFLTNENKVLILFCGSFEVDVGYKFAHQIKLVNMLLISDGFEFGNRAVYRTWVLRISLSRCFPFLALTACVLLPPCKPLFYYNVVAEIRSFRDH